MIKKALIGAGVLLAVLVVAAGALYAGNSAPAHDSISVQAMADPSRPFVVKLHAQWCPVCLMTKGAWSEIADRYGSVANLVVFDVTNDETRRASETEAARLGLGEFFADTDGFTGAIAVLDGGSREVRALLGGKVEMSEYYTAIDASLAARRSNP